MMLQALLAVLPQPERPLETGDEGSWLVFEASIGITFPVDYKEYITTFGSGSIGAFIMPYNPFCLEPMRSLLLSYERWPREAMAIQALQHQYGADVFPFPVYPAPGGVLPWGTTANGDRLFWQTVGLPDAWTVMVNAARSSTCETFTCSMTEFLAGLITGTIRSTIIPFAYLEREKLFEPF